MSLSFTQHAIAAVLAAGAVAAAWPAAAGTAAFSGTTMNDTPPPSPSPLCAPGQVRIDVSPGNAIAVGSSNFGNFAPTFAHCLTPPPTTYSGGVFDFTFEAGDKITGSYSGHFTPTATPNVVNSFVEYVVTGGTGRFAGATGAIHGVGILDRSVPRPLNNLTLNGSITAPGVPEPATWAMLILGFGLSGAALRRRTAAPSL